MGLENTSKLFYTSMHKKGLQIKVERRYVRQVTDRAAGKAFEALSFTSSAKSLQLHYFEHESLQYMHLCIEVKEIKDTSALDSWKYE